MLNYSSANPPPKSRITNKRVAFPLSSGAAQVQNPVTVPLIPAAPNMQLELTLQNFAVLLSEVDENEHLEIKQKLELLKKNWSEGVLPTNAQKCIYDISDSLRKRDIAKANEIQLKLTMEYGIVCTPWMGLIRRFLAVIQTKT